MGLVPFAFSIHQIVSSVGADVGFAAIVGLAILVLLYFAQARETANLREQAFQAAQRVEHLEARIAQVARGQTVSAPAPVGATPAGATLGVSRAVPAAVAVGARSRMAPGAPAGVAAPALAAATKMIPTAVPAVSQPVPAVVSEQNAPAISPSRSVHDGAPAAEPAAADVPAVAAATAGARAVESEPPRAGVVAAAPAVSGEPPMELATAGVVPLEPAPEVTAVAGPAYEGSAGVPPATFAGAGNGAARDYAYAPPAADRGAPPPATDRGAPPPTERPRVRPIAPRRRPLDPEPPRRRSRVGRLIALLAGAAAAGALLVVILTLTQNSGTSSSPSQNRNAASTHSGKKAATFNPSTVTVAVLNGTAVPGLAGRTAARLAALGYKQGTVATASNQTFTGSVVAYLPGHHADALQVARALKLKPSAVQPIDSNTQAVACAQSPCNAAVVVTTGADIASH
jgi:hypothetical protein